MVIRKQLCCDLQINAITLLHCYIVTLLHCYIVTLYDYIIILSFYILYYIK